MSAALVPTVRYPLVRYHGVLAPKSSWRKAVVPAPRAAESAATSPCGRGKAREAGGRGVEKKKSAAHDDSENEGAVPRRTTSAARVTNEPPEPPAHENKTALGRGEAIAAAELVAPNMLRVQHWERLRGGALYAARPRVDWAKLLRRTFDVDVLVCPTCSGRLRVLGAVTDAAEARELLERLGLPADAPTTARARDPTADDLETGTDAWYADG